MNVLIVFVIIAVGKISSNGASMLNIINLQDGEYVNSCTAVDQKVCMSCGTVGVCKKAASGNGYTVEYQETCSGETVCEPLVADGVCYLLGPSSSQCTCDNGLSCKVDPNDALSYITCSGGTTTFQSCNPGETFDVTTCQCKTIECPACGGYPNSLTNCSKYIYCGGGALSEGYCPGDFCFDPNTCLCTEACPSCGYKPNPNNSSLYIYCDGGSNVPGACPAGFIFNSQTCSCENKNLTITTTTVPSIVCPACGYASYPGDTTKYYECNADGTVAANSCPAGFNFEPALCYCV